MSGEHNLSGEDLHLHSAVLIFYDTKTSRFLVEERSYYNEVMGGATIFPGEKGVGSGIFTTAQRGVNEEMGNVRISKYTLLPTFWGSVGMLGDGIIGPILITEWKGKIQNLEPEKGAFKWVKRNEIMSRLTLPESKTLCLVALAALGLVKKEDFEEAPKIDVPNKC